MNVNRKQTQQTVSAGFPLLSYKELAECLEALGISVNVDDISKPSPAITQQIFLQLVDILMGSPMESMEGPKATLLGMMEYKVRMNAGPKPRRRSDRYRSCMGTR